MKTKSRSKLWIVPLVIALMAHASVAVAQSVSPCAQAEVHVLSEIFAALQGSGQTDQLAAALRGAANCLDSPELGAYQRFSLTYTTAYGHYVLGITRRSADEFARARRLFERAVELYEEPFDQPQKRDFASFMGGWCTWRAFELDPQANSPSLDECIQLLSNPERFGSLADDARLLRALALMRRAEIKEAEQQLPDAYADLKAATQALRAIRIGPGSLQEILNVAALKAVHGGLALRLAGSAEAPNDDEIRNLLELVGEAEGPCAASASCLRCLAGLALDLRQAIRSARSSRTFQAPGLNCASECGGQLQPMRAILALQALSEGDNSIWTGFARLLHYWRGRVPDIGPGGGILPPGLFQGTPQDSNLVSLAEYGRLLLSIANCNPQVPEGELPALPELHANELLGNGPGPTSRAIWYLALAPLSNGCLYGLAANILAGAPAPADPNAACELAILRAYALGRGGLGGGNYAAALNVLNAVDEAALDTPHRVELYLAKGLVRQAWQGWDDQTVQYLDQYDDRDPRAAYFLHHVQHPMKPSMGPLRRALYQTERLIEQGYALGWLRDRLRAIPGLTPDPNAPPAELLPDDPPRRWDILRPDLSEVNIARRLYLDVLDALSLYVAAFLPVPNAPRPWWQLPPAGVQGPREIYLQSEIPVALTLDGAPWPAHVWVLQGDQLVREMAEYRGEEFELMSGVRYQLTVYADGHWPTYVDTFFVEPHQRLAVKLLPAMQVSSTRPVGPEEGPAKLSLWYCGDRELTYDPVRRTYELSGSPTVTLEQREGEPFRHITKFVRGEGGEVWLLDVGNNQVLRYAGTSSAGPEDVIDLGALGLHRVVDISRVLDGFVLADPGAHRVVKVDLSFRQVTWRSDSLGWRPTSVLGLPRYGDLVWVADAYGGTLRLLRDGQFKDVPGLEASVSDGFTSPGRLLWLDGLNYVGVTDFFTSGLFLFLPNGEYVGFLRMGPGTGPLLWVCYEGIGTKPAFRVSHMSAQFTMGMATWAGYRFQFLSRPAPEHGQPMGRFFSGGLLQCLETEW